MRSGGEARRPLSSSLADEGFENVGAERLVEGFARHLTVVVDRRQEEISWQSHRAILRACVRSAVYGVQSRRAETCGSSG